ncbi:protein sel-1 homolog 3 [Discoglossus pictus]
MGHWQYIPWQDPRAPLIFLCMVPLLCSCKETMSITKQYKQDLNHEDFLELQNLPSSVTNSNISVDYLCTRPCTVHLDVMASSEFRTGILIFKKRFKNENYLREVRTRNVNVKLPSILIYRNDYFMKHYVDVYYVVVRAWVVHTDTIDPNMRHNETIAHAVAKTFAVLDIIPPLQRPYKDHHVCLTWGFEQLWRQKEHTAFICPIETDIVKVLDFPLASRSESHGVIKTFDQFRNKELEMRRQTSNNRPKFTFSIWLYLLHYCISKECSILHHVDTSKIYATPLLFLTDTGQVHVQIRLVKGVDVAMLTSFQLPLYSWFRLDIALYGRKITLTTLEEDLSIYGQESYKVDEDIYLDDTDGYLNLGGSKYAPGIEGLFGPVKYYRLRGLDTDKISNPLSEGHIYEQVNLYYQRCIIVQDIVQLYTSIIGKAHQSHTTSEERNHYVQLYTKYGLKPTCQALPWTKEEQDKFNVFNLLHGVDWPSLDMSNNLVLDFGKKIYDDAMKKLSTGLHHLGDVIPSLVDSSCVGYHKATYFLAVMYEVGLGVPTDPIQGLLYSLVGGQGGDRLALLKLGYKHFQGTDNYPLDLDTSYAYYISIGKQTPEDRSAKYEEQAFVETIRLMDDDILKEQTRENGDIFLWLKQNAERGDVDAQHRLAQMLFWGQQGVSKNIEAALEWYERGAVENEDPVLMYDYAVLLFKGDGVPKNTKLALKLMKKAAAKGQHEALNGLGWYYYNIRKDYAKATKYWRKAYEKGNVDSAFNIGLLYLHGLYPGEPQINETRAVEYIFTASEGGHIEGIIEYAQYLITGSLKSVPRDPKMAVISAKHVAEQNGYLGRVIREALDSYLDGSFQEALLYYTLTAEAGVEMSQTNLAYLCEEIPELNTKWLTDTCVWRYYNLSAYQYNPPSFALLKMGDLYYYGGRNQTRDADSSMWMYTRAAMQGDSQGFFNLAQLFQEGISIPEDLLHHLNIDKSIFNNNESLILELYERCESHSNEEALSPCSLMLLFVHLHMAWKYVLCSCLVYVLGSLLLSILIAFAVNIALAIQGNVSLFRRLEASQTTHSVADHLNIVSNPEQEGTSAPHLLETPYTEVENTHLNRWNIINFIGTMKQIIRRHRGFVQWLITGLALAISMYYMAFAIKAI